jgi:MFS transporter, FSR family, fosmidomycin resistance protein
MTVAAPAAAGRREIEVIALVGFGHGVSHFFHLLIPPLFPWLMRDFNLTFTEAGALTAVFFAVSGAGQAASGFIVDHVGARRVLLAGMVLFASAAIMLGLAPNYATLVVAAALAGFGNSVFHPADFSLLNRNVGAARLGHAFSVHGLSGNLGWALAPVFMTGIALAWDWRSAAFAAAGLAALAYGLIYVRRDTLRVPASYVETAAAPGVSTSLFAFLGSGAVWLCFLFFFLVTMAFGGLQNYGPSVLQQLYGMSLPAGASALTAFLLGGAAGIGFGGFLVARNDAHERLVAVVLTAASLAALAIASSAVPLWSVTALMAVMGFCSGMAGPSRDMLVRRAATARFGTRSFGRVYGFVYAGLDVGLATAPFVFGPMMDARRFAAVLGGVALLQTLAVLTALRIGRTRRVPSA